YEDQNAYESTKEAAAQGLIDLAAAQHAMREFLDRKALVTDFDARKQAVEADASEALSRLNAFVDDVALKTAQLQHWEEQLADPAKLPPTKKQRTRRSLTDEVKNELIKRLTDARIKLSELQRLYNNPETYEIKNQLEVIKDIKASIDGMATANDEDTWVEIEVDNPVYLSAVSDRDKLEHDLVGLAATVDL